jgi:hypothetical protein
VREVAEAAIQMLAAAAERGAAALRSLTLKPQLLVRGTG